MSSRHSVLSVNVICEYLIPSSLYCMRIVSQQWIMQNWILIYMCYRLLFQGEDIVVEKLVQLLIGEVDTQLLKGVSLRENKNYLAYKSGCSICLSNSSNCVC